MGDVLNILILINQAFYERAYYVFNPRNAMYISKSNGLLNKDVLIQRDTLINANTLRHLAEKEYTDKDLKAINKLVSANANKDYT